MNRVAKTHSALIALARTRRMQRALSHAQLHRTQPLPALRGALSFVTSTTRVSEDASPATPRGGHRMWIAGIAREERAAYVVEEMGLREAPIVYRLGLEGLRYGHLVPIYSWYDGGRSPQDIRARLAALVWTLEPVARLTTEAWMLSTRVVQRRALRLASAAPDEPPIRKFALQLGVEPVSGHGPSGKTTVTAFLRANATLADVWAVPGGDAIARVTYTGIPDGLGRPRDTMVLMTERLR